MSAPDPPPESHIERRLVFDELHPLVAEAAEPAWSRGDYPQALTDAWFTLRDLVRQRLGSQADGSDLMTAIGETNPNLTLTPYDTATARDMHRGVVRFLGGIAFYVRNPEMHETESPVAGDRVGALERLAIMSLCARHVEASASPVAVDQVIKEASQPMFSATNEAADDLVHSLPTSLRPPLVEALVAGMRDAADATRANNLRNVYFRALHRLDSTNPAVTRAADLCGQLIASDDTLLLGIELSTPTVLKLLAPRHRSKVLQALRRDVLAGRMHRGRLTVGGTYREETIALFAEFDRAEQAVILAAASQALAGPWEQQAFGMSMACGLVPYVDSEQAEDLADKMATAIVNDNPFDAAKELTQAQPTLPPEFRELLADKLEVRTSANAPGQEMAQAFIGEMREG